MRRTKSFFHVETTSTLGLSIVSNGDALPDTLCANPAHNDWQHPAASFYRGCCEPSDSCAQASRARSHRRRILNAQFDKMVRLMTDEVSIYTKAGKKFAEPGVVNHNGGEYAHSDSTTNTVESSFALLKRGLYGTFHKVNEIHLPRYATEFDFRWNHRENLGFTDIQWANMMLVGTAGKRLMYRDS